MDKTPVPELEQVNESTKDAVERVRFLVSQFKVVEDHERDVLTERFNTPDNSN